MFDYYHIYLKSHVIDDLRLVFSISKLNSIYNSNFVRIGN